MQILDYQTQENWQSTSAWQSPIALDLASLTPKPLTQQNLTLTFGKAKPIKATPSPSGMQFEATASLNFKQQTYQLQRFHFHDGSEHLLANQRLAGEIHFVFSNAQETLVLAVLCQVDTNFDDDLFAKIYQENLSNEQLAQLIPQNRAYVTYLGTLTTPPLTPDIRWIVLTTPLKISLNSKKVIQQAFANNHRQVQPLNGRKISYYQ